MQPSYKQKRIPADDRLELTYGDVSRRAASVARLIDRMPDGIIQIRIEKDARKWVIQAEHMTTVQILDLTQ